MPVEYTDRVRAAKPAVGEDVNAWGDRLNDQTFDMFDEALNGVASINLAGAATLDLSSATYTKNGESDTSRRMVLVFSNPNAAGSAITILGKEKVYFVWNAGGAGNITLAPSGGTVATVRPGQKTWVYSDGTNCFESDPTLDKIKAPAATVNLGAQKMQSSAPPTVPNDFVNKTYADAIITTAAGYASAASDSSDDAEAAKVAAQAALADFEAQYTSDSSEPVSPGAGYLWFDEANNQMKVRNAGNTAWAVITVAQTASETLQGIIEIVNQSEFNSKTDDTRAVTSKKIFDSAIVAFTDHLLLLADEKTNNTAGKSYTNVTWTIADLNTSKVNQISGASLATNQVTLPAGTYVLYGAFGFGGSTGTARVRIRDTTNSATLGSGVSGKGAASTWVNIPLFARFTLAGAAVLEFQVYATSTGTSAGTQVNSGEVECYNEVAIYKVA